MRPNHPTLDRPVPFVLSAIDDLDNRHWLDLLRLGGEVTPTPGQRLHAITSAT